MTYNEAQQLLASTGWTSDYWWNNREFFNHPEAPRQWVFLHQDDIGIDDPYSTEISLIYCDMTADELREYTRLCKAMWQCEANPEQTTIAEYREVRKEHKGFVQAMRRKKSGGILAKVNREPGGLTERFRKELKETKEAIERGDYKEPAGLGPVISLMVVGDKIVQDVGGQTVERIRIVFPDTSEAEKEFISHVVLKHAAVLLSDQLRARAMAKHLHKEWMTLYASAYGERYTDVYVIPKKNEPIEVAFITL